MTVSDHSLDPMVNHDAQRLLEAVYELQVNA